MSKIMGRPRRWNYVMHEEFCHAALIGEDTTMCEVRVGPIQPSDMLRSRVTPFCQHCFVAMYPESWKVQRRLKDPVSRRKKRVRRKRRKS